MAKTQVKTATEKHYDALIKTIPEIERKGAKLPYTSLNGNMFSILSKEGEVGIRLDKPDREVFLKKYNTRLLHTYGAVMREYVTVPPLLLKNTKELSKYIKMSLEYAKTLKPKATTKLKSIAKKKQISPKKKK